MNHIYKGLIILGSAKSDGNTRKLVDHGLKQSGFDFIDLKEYEINQFDYGFSNQNDDFLPLIKKIIDKYDLIVFATPVYWYAMSGIMKSFFDRLTDLLKQEKEAGRKLRGKSMAMICGGSDAEMPEGFQIPFKKTAEYLGMKFLGSIYTSMEDDALLSKQDEKSIEEFVHHLIAERTHPSVKKMWADFIKKNNEYANQKMPIADYFCANKKDADECAELVVNDIKRATCAAKSSYDYYDNGVLPKVGLLSIITNWEGEAQCIIKTSSVLVKPYNEVDATFALREGEGDKSLEYWKRVHWEFFTHDLAAYGQKPSEDMLVVCEEFERIF